MSPKTDPDSRNYALRQGRRLDTTSARLKEDFSSRKATPLWAYPTFNHTPDVGLGHNTLFLLVRVLALRPPDALPLQPQAADLRLFRLRIIVVVALPSLYRKRGA